MNYITIKKIIDLELILTSSIFISGKEFQLQKEIYENGWGIMLDNEIILYITVEDVAQFITNLVKARTEQLLMIKPVMKATLYIWFDHQALQLCFNILSGEDRSLPFGCKLNILESPYPIFKKYLSVARNNFLYGNYLEITDIIDNTNDSADDEDDEDQFEKFILDVWKITLPWDSEAE